MPASNSLKMKHMLDHLYILLFISLCDIWTTNYCNCCVLNGGRFYGSHFIWYGFYLNISSWSALKVQIRLWRTVHSFLCSFWTHCWPLISRKFSDVKQWSFVSWVSIELFFEILFFTYFGVSIIFVAAVCTHNIWLLLYIPI